MSTHNAKKKRMGSRRSAVNQNEMDERPSTDPAESSSAVKEPEETEVLENPHGSESVPPDWPSPQLKGNKRKFGSRRKQRGLLAGEVAPVLHHKEAGEETTDDSETIQVSTLNSPDQSHESQTCMSPNVQLHESNPHVDSSELDDSNSGEIFTTDGNFSRGISDTAQSPAQTCHQSKEMCINSPDQAGPSVSETAGENMQHFIKWVDPDGTDEANERDELSGKESEERKNESELLKQTDDFRGLYFQSESLAEDDSWVQLNADFSCRGTRQEALMPLEDAQKEHVDSEVDDNLISVAAVDGANLQLDTSQAGVPGDVTAWPAEGMKTMVQSELGAEVAALKHNDFYLANQEIKHDEKLEILPSQVNVADGPDEDTGASAEGRLFSEVEQGNVLSEEKQDLLLPVPDCNHRIEELATTAASSQIETEISWEAIVDPSLTENSSGEDQKRIQALVCDDAAEDFSPNLAMEEMQIEQSHVRDEQEKSRPVVSINEDVNCDGKQDENQTEGSAHRVLDQTSEQGESDEDAGLDRNDTGPGEVHQPEDDGRESKGLDLDVQAILDPPPTRLEQMDSVSQSQKKLEPNAQDTGSSQQPAEEATRRHDDHEAVESTVSSAPESEVGDQFKGAAPSVALFPCVTFDVEIEKLPDDESSIQQSDSPSTKLLVVGNENFDPVWAETPSSLVKENMQTDGQDEETSTALTRSEMEIDSDCLSASPQISVKVPNTPEVDGSSATEYGSDSAMDDLDELEGVNQSNVQSKTYCLEVDSIGGGATSEKLPKDGDVEGRESTGPSPSDEGKSQSRVEDSNLLHPRENSNSTSFRSTDGSESKGDGLNYECKEEENRVEEKDFEKFPRTRRKLGSSRKKKPRPPAQDTDLFQQHSQEPLTEAIDHFEGSGCGLPGGDIPELDADRCSAPEGEELEEDSYSLGADGNQQRFTSESHIQSTCEEALTVQSKEENQSDSPCSCDPSTLPGKDKDHVDQPEGRKLLLPVDEEADKPPVDDSLVLQSVGALQSLTHGESRDGEPGPPGFLELLEAGLHPPFEKTLGQNVTTNEASEELRREVVSGRDQIAETASDPTEKTSAREENQELNQFGLQENSEVPQQVQQSTAGGACRLQQVDLQSKQKRRKMGSTRRGNFDRPQEEEMFTSSEAKTKPAEQTEKVDAMVESGPGIDLEEPNIVSPAAVKGDDSVIPEKVDDVTHSDRKSDAVMEELEPDGLITAGKSSTAGPTKTDWSLESGQDGEDRLESVLSDQLLESAAKSIVAANLERVKSELRGGDEEDPTDESEEARGGSLRSEARRRKMGSTRKSLASRRAGEDLSGQQGDDGEETGAQVLDTDAPRGEDTELTPRKVLVVETVERSCTTESYLRPQATTEEQQVGRSLTVPPPPRPDAMSETAASGRRRKMGSNRKSHGYQRNRDQVQRPQEPEARDKVTRAAEEKAPSVKTVPEDGGDKKTPVKTVAVKSAEETKPLHGETSSQGAAAQEASANRPGNSHSPNTFSFEHPSAGTLPSKSYNVILIGDSSVGKTSFMKRVQTGTFSLDLPASVGTDSCVSSVLVDGKRVSLQLWDTAGQERFHSITRQIFHRAQAFLLMYDVTSSQSFSDVSYWANCIQESATDNVTIMMLGNKSDSATRQVQSQDGEVLAKEYNFEFMECSAATGHNVTLSLETVARSLSGKCDTREETTPLHREPPKKLSSRCC